MASLARTRLDEISRNNYDKQFGRFPLVFLLAHRRIPDRIEGSGPPSIRHTTCRSTIPISWRWTMAPSKKVEQELQKEALDIFRSSERDLLTVNLVRERVEARLGLGSGFLSQGEWKLRSKSVIKAEVVRQAR